MSESPVQFWPRPKMAARGRASSWLGPMEDEQLDEPGGADLEVLLYDDSPEQDEIPGGPEDDPKEAPVAIDEEDDMPLDLLVSSLCDHVADGDLGPPMPPSPLLYEPTSPRSDSSAEAMLDEDIEGGGTAPPTDTAPPEDHLGGAGPTGPRDRAEIVVQVGEGATIRYYERTNRFVAQCVSPFHQDGHCFKTRTSLPSARREAVGRPLGHLAAWLFQSGAYDDKGTHFECQPSHDDRAAARDFLHEMEGAELLFAHERPQRPGEGPEPEGLA